MLDFLHITEDAPTGGSSLAKEYLKTPCALSDSMADKAETGGADDLRHALAGQKVGRKKDAACAIAAGRHRNLRPVCTHLHAAEETFPAFTAS